MAWYKEGDLLEHCQHKQHNRQTNQIAHGSYWVQTNRKTSQMMGTLAYSHKALKLYHSIFHNAIETALVNGDIVYHQSLEENDKIMNPVLFRKVVIDGLLENFERKSVL